MDKQQTKLLVIGNKSNASEVSQLKLLLSHSPRKFLLYCGNIANCQQITSGSFKYAVLKDARAPLQGRQITGVWVDDAADLPEIRECIKLAPAMYWEADQPNNRHQRRKDAAEARRSARYRKR